MFILYTCYFIQYQRLSTICKPSQSRRNQHSTVNRQNIDRVIDRPNNKNKELTSLKHLIFFTIIHFILIIFSIFTQ